VGRSDSVDASNLFRLRMNRAPRVRGTVVRNIIVVRHERADARDPPPIACNDEARTATILAYFHPPSFSVDK